MKVATAKLFVLAIVISSGAQLAIAQNTMIELLRSEWELSRKQMLQIAGRMPAEDYQYKPPHETRTFGEIVAHVAGENITWMESVAGEAKPGLGDRYEKLKTRDELLKAFAGMYDYGAKVLASLDDRKALELAAFEGKQRPRWFIVMEAIGHAKEHHGNLVTYLNVFGAAPPAERIPPR